MGLETYKGAIFIMGKWKRCMSRGILLMLAALLLAALAACSSRSNDKQSDNAAAMSAPMEDRFNTTLTSTSNAVQFSEASKSKELSGAPVASAATEASSAYDSSAAGDAQGAFGGGIGPIADANAGFDRKVIYRANLVMKVEEFKVAEEQLLDLIHLGGAYVLQFSDSRNVNEVGASYVIKVPSSGFSSFLEKLQQIKSLKFEREVEGNDVTEEFVDLDARLKAKQTVETRLLSFMDKATKSDDLVRFSNALAEVQGEIEQIKGRIRYLDQNVAFSTINLRLYQASGIEEIKVEKEVEKNIGDRLSDALSGSVKVLGQLGEGLLVVIAAILPMLVVIVIIGIPAYYLVRKRNAARRMASEENRRAWNNSSSTPSEAESPILDRNPDSQLNPKEEDPNQ